MWTEVQGNNGGSTPTIDALVPTMTSDTQPYGEAKASTVLQTGREAYKAFDNIDSASDLWHSASTAAGVTHWIQYKFTKLAKVKKVKFKPSSVGLNALSSNVILQGSYDGTNFTNIKTLPISTADYNNLKEIDVGDNENYYLYYRLSFSPFAADGSSRYYTAMISVQFYGYLISD